MKLHTVFITYNRLELTKRAIASYLETVTLPFTVTVVDNASSDGTPAWIMEQENFGKHLLNENRYPGYACNLGWEWSRDATHLHRADNDFIFLDGWDKEVERMFSAGSNLGQLGLRTDEEENFITINTGGNCIIRRELWDKGLRYDERPWPQLAKEIGAGWTEDSLFSPAVARMGYTWERVKRPCIQPISRESMDDPYYLKSWTDRGIKKIGHQVLPILE